MQDPANHRTGIRVTFGADQDIFCTTCGYNLRGAEGASCPECGVPFRLAVAGQSEHYLLYLIALVCTSGLAFLGHYIIYVIADLLTDPVNLIGMYGAYELITYVINLIALPYLALLIVLRKAIVSSSIGVQLAWAIPPMIGVGAEFLYTLYSVVVYY